MLVSSLLLALVALIPVRADDGTPPHSFPHNYPGIPNTVSDFSNSTEWQNYFLVNYPLPNQTFLLERSFAGNVPVNREGHINNTLFFWGFEKIYGSLTRPTDLAPNDPWIIWLNGGPGTSSIRGLLFENGPVQVANDSSLVQNPFAWNTLADTIWVDQPVGTGWSTVDSDGYIDSEDQMGQDFLGFLTNLVQIFPSLATRPLVLMGEGYAGTYIPYITKTYFSTPNPPVKLVKFAIGNGAIGSQPAYEDVPVTNILETYPQLINYDPAVFKYFKQQRNLCGYDLNLTYPQGAPFPSLRPNQLEYMEYGAGTLQAPGTFQVPGGTPPRVLAKRAFRSALAQTSKPSSSLSKRELLLREERKASWKRGVLQGHNGTIDPTYQCSLLFELLDYAVNFTQPWCTLHGSDHKQSCVFEPATGNPFPGELGFDVYSIPDAVDALPPQDASVFLNDPVTRAALHAPNCKDWAETITYPFQSNLTNFLTPGTNQFGDPSVEPSAFLSDLATKSNTKNVAWLFYSGNDDFLVSHLGTEVAIQNTTFGGIQGFTQRPSTAWYDDNGTFAGIVHQERNLTYVLFDHAGHLVPQWQPSRALTFLREFVLGSNTTGSVANKTATVGRNFPLADHVLPGERNPIFTGFGATLGSTVFPSATVASWDKFVATATLSPNDKPRSGAVLQVATTGVAIVVAGLVAMTLA